MLDFYFFCSQIFKTYARSVVDFFIWFLQETIVSHLVPCELYGVDEYASFTSFRISGLSLGGHIAE